ncbi:hypothetical protein ACS0TY_027572 [Phlomoides rotata]
MTLAKWNELDYKYALIVCDKAGTSKANKFSKKIDCKARLNTKKLDDESWTVTKMVTEHNHEIDSSFSPLMPTHKHLSVHMKRQLEANDIARIRPCKNVRLCEVQKCGPGNLGCLPKDCRNSIEERKRLRLGGGDAETIHKMFDTLQLKDRNVYHLMDIDEEGRLCNVFWIHPRSKAAYEDFHDVVSFDTTYLVNSLVQDEIKRILYGHVVPPTTDEQIEDLNDIEIERFMSLERSILNNYFLKEFTYIVDWRPIKAYIKYIVNERYLLYKWRNDVYHRHSCIFLLQEVIQTTEKYNKFQEVEKYFQQCADATMGSTLKMEYIKETCIDMKNELLNWTSRTTTTDGDPSVWTS